MCIRDRTGIIQAWGGGHSMAGAMEVAHRAGGFIPTKKIVEPSNNAYETVERAGEIFMKKVDVQMCIRDRAYSDS